MSSTTLEQLERERQATLKAIVSTGEDKKDSRERRQQLQKVMASFAECKMDDATRVCTSVDQVSSAKMPARLVLSQKGLDHLPPEVCGLKNLVELSLVGNTIKTLPAALGNCRGLRSLSLGANCLKALPDLAQVSLLHLGLACNEVDDASLPTLLSCLPAGLVSLDLGTNGLCSLDDTLDRLQVLRSLKHLTLLGNPLCVRHGYRKAVLATTAGGRLVLLDNTPVADTSADDVAVPTPEADTPAGGEAEGAEEAPAEEQPADAGGKVTLRFELGTLEGLPPKKVPKDGAEAEAAAEAEPPKMVTVEFSVLGETFSTEPVAWADSAPVDANFTATLPRSTLLRSALVVRGVTFRVMLQPPPPPPPPEGADEGGAVPEESPEPTVVGEIGSFWQPLLDGIAASSQKCVVTVTPEAKPRKSGRKAKKPPPPFTLSLGVSCSLVS